MSQPQMHIVITKSEKNPIVGALLGFFFGFIGLFYSSPKAALIMLAPTLLSCVLIPFFIGIPMIVMTWIACGVVGYVVCDKHNKSLHNTVQETVQNKAA